MSSIAAAAGSTVGRVGARRARRGEAEHRPDPLAAGEQRVAHRLVEARGRLAVGEPQALEVLLDQPTQIVRVIRPPRRLPQPSSPSASRSARSISLPASLTSSAASRASSAARSSLTSGSPSCSESCPKLRGELAHARRRIAHDARLGALARGRAEDPVDEPGRVGAAVLAREVDRLVDRDLDRQPSRISCRRDPHDRPLQRRDPVQLPAAREPRDLLVELRPAGRRCRARARA